LSVRLDKRESGVLLGSDLSHSVPSSNPKTDEYIPVLWTSDEVLWEPNRSHCWVSRFTKHKCWLVTSF
jgi:hypothetical protein